jgi:Domain of unknown function (DUF4160)
MFFDDHGPPHFHARHAEGSAKVRIDSLEVIDTASELASRPALVKHSSRSSRSDDWPNP